jgi:hypothetical protein
MLFFCPSVLIGRSYSGHGGQVPDPDGDRASGFDDTIVPVGILYFLFSSTFYTTSALPPQ